MTSEKDPLEEFLDKHPDYVACAHCGEVVLATGYDRCSNCNNLLGACGRCGTFNDLVQYVDGDGEHWLLCSKHLEEHKAEEGT